jgi:hypothetical protein
MQIEAQITMSNIPSYHSMEVFRTGQKQSLTGSVQWLTRFTRCMLGTGKAGSGIRTRKNGTQKLTVTIKVHPDHFPNLTNRSSVRDLAQQVHNK